MRQKYLLDANVFIEAYRRYYAFDIAPSFWKIIYQLGAENRIISIDRVKQELFMSDKEDSLGKWINEMFNDCFMSTDDNKVFESYGQVISWSQSNNQFTEPAKAEFASVADSWLIAYAKTYNSIIVTHEQYKRDTKRRILIPNVCHEFNIPYLDTFEMLRELKVRF